MKVTLTKIGNSKGVIIPAALLKQLDFKDELLMEITRKGILLRQAPRKPREGWDEQIAREIEKNGHPENVWEDYKTSPDEWDEEEWQW